MSRQEAIMEELHKEGIYTEKDLDCALEKFSFSLGVMASIGREPEQLQEDMENKEAS